MVMNRITTIQDGKKTYDVLTVELGSFNESYSALRKEGVELATAEQIARIRRLSGSDSSLSRNYGQWVADADIHQRRDSAVVLLVDGAHNPILQNIVEATNCHRNGKEFYLNARFVDQLRQLAKKDPRDAIKSGVLALPRPRKSEILGSSEINPFEVPADRLAEEVYFQFRLRDEAKPYGKFLKDAGISKVTVYLVSENSAKDPEHNGIPFARPLWVRYLDYGSEFYGNYRNLDSNGCVRGVRASAVSAKPQKISELESICRKYKVTSPVELKRALKLYKYFMSQQGK